MGDGMYTEVVSSLAHLPGSNWVREKVVWLVELGWIAAKLTRL
jgi:hypothetical protein